jgi:signal recognition particle GTPase
MTQNKLTQEQFLEQFFTSKDSINFRSFYDPKDKSAKKGRNFHATLTNIPTQLGQQSEENYGVFFCPNLLTPNGTTDKDLKAATAFWADEDGTEADIEKMPPPSCIVQSKNGRHFYWLLKEPVTKEMNPRIDKHFKSKQKTIAKLLGTDSAVCNPSRVMRLPETYHCKDPHDHFKVTVTEINDRRYTIEEIEEHLETNKLCSNKENYLHWINEQPKEEGARNATAVKIIKEGLAQGFDDYFLKDTVLKYATDSSYENPEEFIDQLERFRNTHEQTPFKSYQRGVKENTIVFIDRYLREKGIASGLDKVFKHGEKIVQYETLSDRIFVYCKSNKITLASKQLINAVLNTYIEDQYESKLKEKIRELEFKPHTKEDLIRSFSLAINPASSEVDTAIIKHFLHSIKRKMINKRVEMHIMPVFIGDSGSGKTTAIHKLLSPIAELSLEADCSTLSDERHNHNLTEKYVIILDEMANTRRTDMASIKQKITSPTVSQRILGTNKTTKGTNNASFIGTSNLPLGELIKDRTGARRFYELRTASKCDWKVINSINYTELWQSIDENNDEPYIYPFIKQIKTSQEEIRHKDSIESWILEFEIEPATQKERFDIPSKVLYAAFSEWCDKSGYKNIPNIRSFGTRLTEHLGPSKPVKGTRVYKVKNQFPKVEF